MKFITLLFFLSMPLLVGSIGALAPAAQGYAGLIKPFFAPPGWIFGPVWTFLYILIGLSGYLAWQKRKKGKCKQAFAIYSSQLILNALWTPIFFGLGLRLFALVEIIVLWILIIFNIYCFNKIDKRAAWLLVPYFFWVSFATVLTFSIWRIN